MDRFKGKEQHGSGVWMGGEENVIQMEMVDSAYLKAGMPVTPSSELSEWIGGVRGERKSPMNCSCQSLQRVLDQIARIDC